MIKEVVWSSTIDWPHENSTVLFLDGCNFTCEYCHNKQLSFIPDMDFNGIIENMSDRKSFIDHVILSGGEPTLSQDFDYIVDTLYSNGFKIGIHTNGSNVEAFNRNKDKISFVGLDIKSAPYRYFEFVDIKLFSFMGIREYLQWFSIFNDKSIHDIDYEVRTTLDAGMKLGELIAIAYYLRNYNIKEWVLQPEFKEGQRVLHYDKFWYTTTINRLNEILPTRFRSIL